jgi:hypothetical protein
MKARTKNEVAALVAEQLSLVRDQDVAAQIRSLLVEPYAVERAWDYGKPGDSYVCWTVLEHPASNTGIAYCAEGFRDPWGLVWLTGSPSKMSMGMDCGWYLSMEDAFRESAAWEGDNPPDREVP